MPDWSPLHYVAGLFFYFSVRFCGEELCGECQQVNKSKTKLSNFSSAAALLSYQEKKKQKKKLVIPPYFCLGYLYHTCTRVWVDHTHVLLKCCLHCVSVFSEFFFFFLLAKDFSCIVVFIIVFCRAACRLQ